MLKTDALAADIEAPQSYILHKDRIAEHLLSEQGREFDGEGVGGLEEDDNVLALEDVDLTPL